MLRSYHEPSTLFVHLPLESDIISLEALSFFVSARNRVALFLRGLKNDL